MLHSLFRVPALAVALAGALPASDAYAHVTLETREAAIGNYYKAVFKVPHGCEGEPTTAIRVQIPEGVITVKPQPKTGWRIDLERGSYAHEYVLHGKTVREGVKQVAWSGGSLPDDYYDEFVLQAYLTPGLPAGATLAFPLIQECGSRTEHWMGTAAGHGGHAGHAGMSALPAPALRLLPAR